jgi:hypothetical protein
MKYKFYVKDIPEPYTVWKYILENTDIEKHYGMTSSVNYDDIINLKHDLNIETIISSVKDMENKFGYKGWLTSKGENDAYGGLSLVYNPDLKETIDQNQQTLGTKINQPDQFYWSQTENFSSVKNTYYDSYAFRKLAPCVVETEFKSFVKSFKRPLVRSRIATINSKYISEKYLDKFGWHRDEPVFENLRINIPISTDETFLMEVKGKPPQHLTVGNVYSWDTNLPHRAFPSNNEDRSRTHIVLGFSPWFDYNEDEDYFYSNEFYGEMHPIDMLVSGHISESIFGLK